MKIEKTQCEKIYISRVNDLDPITVFLEDDGHITIRCYKDIWSAFWARMGDMTLSQFFLTCDNSYLANKLSNIESNIVDHDAFIKIARKTIGRRLARGEIKKQIAKSLLEELEDCEPEYTSAGNYTLFTSIFGDRDWVFELPKITNPKYAYLCRIIDTVKNALRADNDHCVHISRSKEVC